MRCLIPLLFSPVNTGTPLRRETPAIPPSPGGGTPSAVGYGLC